MCLISFYRSRRTDFVCYLLMLFWGLCQADAFFCVIISTASSEIISVFKLP